VSAHLRDRSTHHVWHRFGPSWRCWLCPAVGSRPIASVCRQGIEPSLSYVPKSRPCALASARSRTEEAL
jgi:hypothetical protein